MTSYASELPRRLPRLFVERFGIPFKETEDGIDVVVTVNERWLFDSVETDWIVGFRLVIQDGKPTIGEIRIFPASEFTTLDGAIEPSRLWAADALGVNARAPRGGITSRLLRCIRFPLAADLLGLDALPRTVDGRIIQSIAGKDYETNVRVPRIFKTKGSRRGRPRLQTDLFFAQLAEQYAILVAKRSHRPIAELAKHHNIPRTKIRDAIRAARTRGFLSIDRPGKPGGQLTDKARDLLQLEATQTNKQSSSKKRPARVRQTPKRA